MFARFTALALVTALAAALSACAAPAGGRQLELRQLIATLDDAQIDGDTTAAETAALLEFDCVTQVVEPAQTLLTCDEFGVPMLLGPASPAPVQRARADQTGTLRGAWSVIVDLTPDGKAALADMTRRLVSYPPSDPRNRMALVLDGDSLAVAAVQAEVTTGSLVISGSFGESTARALADELNAPEN